MRLARPAAALRLARPAAIRRLARAATVRRLARADTVRRLARPAAVVLVLGALLFAAAPASAGGPTSVLLVSPATGRTASLHTTNGSYSTLMSQLGTEPAPGSAPGVTSPMVGGDQIVVTWMIHDVQPWRVDRITLQDGLPTHIHTTQSADGGPIAFAGPGVSHQPADPAALAELLADLGMLGRTGQPPAADDAAAGVSGVSAAAGADAATDDLASSAGTSADATLDTAAWALPAMAGGIVVGVLGDRWLRRRRGGEEGGRWQLVDAPGPQT